MANSSAPGLAQAPQYGGGTADDPSNWAIAPGTGFQAGGPTFIGPHGANGYGTNGRPIMASWGGKVGGAEASANQLGQMAAAARARPGQQVAGLGGGFANPADEVQAEQQQRGMMNDAIRGLANDASGAGPSAAQMQMGAALGGQNLSNAYAAMRGGAGSSAIGSLGQQNAQTVAQGGAGRAAEIGAAQQAYAGAAGQLHGQDIRQQGLAQQAGLAQAQTDLATEKENEQASLAYDTMAQQTEADQLQASTSIYNTGLGNAAQLGAINIANNAATNNATTGALMGATSGLAQSFGGAESDQEYAQEGQQQGAQGLAQDPYAMGGS